MNRYAAVLFGLLALTLLTFLSARELDAYIPLMLRVPIAIGIAGVKAGLVIWFFMHLGEHAPTSRAYVIVALVLLTLMIGLVMADVATRLPTANPGFTAGW
jgi:cytochrome c oxidase subunit 4